MRIYVLDGEDPKDSENTLKSFLTKSDGNAFWQISADMYKLRGPEEPLSHTNDAAVYMFLLFQVQIYFDFPPISLKFVWLVLWSDPAFNLVVKF